MMGKELEGRRFRLVKYLSYGTGEKFNFGSTGKIDTFVTSGMSDRTTYYRVYFDGQQHTTYYYIRRNDFELMDELDFGITDEDFLL